MSLISLQGSIPLASIPVPTTSVSTSVTLDAAGESAALIGKVHLEGRTGSKTISSAGGEIWFATAAVTFANGGTNLRVGIQDVDATTGLEDTTWDVYKDFTGGGGGVSTSVYNAAVMASGSKTISHGDIVAVVVEMTTRGGADSVVLQRMSVIASGSLPNQIGFPYGTADTGTLAKASLMPIVFLKFDDGTFGWIQGTCPYYLPAQNTRHSFSSSTTPDEYAAVFRLPFKCKIDAVGIDCDQIDSTDAPEIILYSDPLGTPVADVTLTPDMDEFQGLGIVNGGAVFQLASEYTIEANTWYALSVRPTTTAALEVRTWSVGSGFEDTKRAGPFGADILHGTRTNQSGAFSTTLVERIPDIVLFLSQLDDGAGGSGTAFIIGG